MISIVSSSNKQQKQTCAGSNDSKAKKDEGKVLSEVGFEPTPTFVDQNTHSATYLQRRSSLESGALDRSAILTTDCNTCLNLPIYMISCMNF